MKGWLRTKLGPDPRITPLAEPVTQLGNLYPCGDPKRGCC